MSKACNIHFCVTGGTLTMGVDTKVGGLVPQFDIHTMLQALSSKTSHKNIPDLLSKKYSIANISVSEPFIPFIDSLNFDLEEHFIPLLNAILQALEKNESVIVVGGTDSLAFYAPLLAHYIPLLQKGQSVIFLSSMRPYGSDPDHCISLIDNALKLACCSASGVFALMASNENATICDVYNLNTPNLGLEKVFQCEPSAFRALVEPQVFKNTKSAFFTDQSIQSSLVLHSNFRAVAPPLILGNNIDIVLSYMQYFAGHDIIIEGGPFYDSLTQKEKKQFLDTIGTFCDNGDNVYFVNCRAYDIDNHIWKAYSSKQRWQQSPFLHHAKENGALVIDDSNTMSVYINALTQPPNKHAVTGSFSDANKIHFLKIMYIPFPRLIEHALGLIAQEGQLVLRTLLNGISDKLRLPFEIAAKERDIRIMTGTKYPTKESPYASGKVSLFASRINEAPRFYTQN